MRKFLLPLIFISNVNLNSQTIKGKWLFENTFGNVYNNEADWEVKNQSKINKYNDKIFEINVDINAAFLPIKNLAVGTGLYSYFTQIISNGFSSSGNKIAEGSFKNYELLAVPFVRYYLNPDSKSSLYFQLGAGGGGDIVSNNDYTNYYETGGIYSKSSYNITDHSIFTLQVNVGLNYFFNEYIAFNTCVGFNYTSVKYTDNVASNYPLVPSSSPQVYYLSSNQKIILWRFGFTVMLGKKKEKPVAPTKGA